jgi:hypothetical protein
MFNFYGTGHLSSVKHCMWPGSVSPNMLWADPQGASWVFQMLSADRLNYIPHTCTAVIQIFIFVIVMHETYICFWLVTHFVIFLVIMFYLSCAIKTVGVSGFVEFCWSLKRARILKKPQYQLTQTIQTWHKMCNLENQKSLQGGFIGINLKRIIIT